MNLTSTNCSAKNISIDTRKIIALQAIQKKEKIINIAANNQVSRDFVYAQKNKAINAVDIAFQAVNDNDVLFYLPITKKWLVSFILCLMLHCRACYRGISKLLVDAFDYNISIATIHNIVTAAATTAKNINIKQDLTGLTVAAHDELFHHDKPILTGVDIPTLYCHLLSKEDSRDGDTWAINLLDLEKQNFNPARVIADDGSGLRLGHALALGDIPCDLDNFHILKDLMDMRRYFQNKEKSSTTFSFACEKKLMSAKNQEVLNKCSEQLNLAIADEKLMKYLSTNINILVSWMDHDILNKPGSNISERRELFNFVVEELENLAQQHPHRILPICIKLRDGMEMLLSFVDVLEKKFMTIAEQHQCSIDIIWEICQLQRCQYLSDNYMFRSEGIVERLGDSFDAIEEAVMGALDSTERTSSLVENLNSRISAYLFVRKYSDQKFLDLLQYFFNHTPFLRSERDYRVKKTPTELLTGKSHDHWLKLLGCYKFQRAA
jgi:hypothetical protein